MGVKGNGIFTEWYDCYGYRHPADDTGIDPVYTESDPQGTQGDKKEIRFERSV